MDRLTLGRKETEASQILASFAETAIDNARSGILRDALRGSSWKTIGMSILSNFLYTLIVLGVVVVIAVTGLDIPTLLEKFARVLR